jgi:hypothetical protein
MGPGGAGINFAFTLMVLAVVFFWLGTVARQFAPAHLLTEDIIRTLRWFSAPILIVVALALAMMLVQARSSFNDKGAALESISGHALQLNRAALYYGHRADKVRVELLKYMKHLEANNLYGVLGPPQRGASNPTAKAVYEMELPPNDAIRTVVKQRMIDSWGLINEVRTNLAVQSDIVVYRFTIGMTMLWLLTLFSLMGFSSPVNPVTLTAGAVVAMTTASLFFLIGEFSHPLEGMINLSHHPLEVVIKTMEKDLKLVPPQLEEIKPKADESVTPAIRG